MVTTLSPQPVLVQRAMRGLALVLALLLIGAAAPILPFGRDQGEYAAIASEALSGKTVYRDVFNVKPPMTHLVHQASILVFGHSMSAIRFMDLTWQTLTALCLAAIMFAFGAARREAFLVAILYAVLYFGTVAPSWNTAQTDGFLNLPVACAILALLRGRSNGRLGWFVASGACFGVATLFKYPIAILLPLVFLAWGLQRESRPASWMRNGGLVLAGFILPLGLFVSSLALTGALPEFLSSQFTFATTYRGHSDGNGIWSGLAAFWWSGRLMDRTWLAASIATRVATILVLFYLVHGWVRRHRPDLPALVGVAWLFAALIHLGVQGKFYPYHVLPVLAPVAVILGDSVSRFQGWLNNKRLWSTLAQVAVGLAVLGLYLAGPGLQFHSAIPLVATGRMPLTEFHRQSVFGPYGQGDFSIAADLEVADYLTARTSPEDTLFVWGFEPTVYFLTDRRAASRFLYNFPLYGEFDWPGYRHALVPELRETRPAYVVVLEQDAMSWVTGTTDDSRAALARFPELNEWLQSDYVFETRIEHFELYRRRAVISSPEAGVDGS